MLFHTWKLTLQSNIILEKLVNFLYTLDAGINRCYTSALSLPKESIRLNHQPWVKKKLQPYHTISSKDQSLSRIDDNICFIMMTIRLKKIFVMISLTFTCTTINT